MLGNSRIILFIILSFTYGNAQNIEWALAEGGTNTDSGSMIYLDSEENILVTGSFYDVVDFDPGPGTFNLTSSGLADVFVQKLDPSGELIWAISFGGGAYESASNVVVDSANNILISGFFEGTVDFDPGPGSTLLSSNGEQDVFVVKLSSEGNLLWALNFGSIESDYAADMVIDSLDAIYLTGRYNNYLPTPDTRQNTTFLSDIYVTKISTTGQTLWFHEIGGPAFDYGTSVALDNTNKVLVGGRFQETVDFDPGSNTDDRTSQGGSDGFLLCFDLDGTYNWARSFGGPNRDFVWALDINDQNETILTGFFNETCDFDPGPNSFNITSQGVNNMFVSKFNSAGDFIQAVAALGEGEIVPNDVYIDSNSSIFITGYFLETVDFDPGPDVVSRSSTGFDDIFLLKLKDDLEFQSIITYGSADVDRGNSVILDDLDNIMLSGEFSETVDFDPGTGSTNLSSNGSRDVFLLKLKPEALSRDDFYSDTDFQYYPNPTSGILNISFSSMETRIDMVIYDVTGKLLDKKQFYNRENISYYLPGSTGLKLVQLTTNDSSTSFKVIKN